MFDISRSVDLTELQKEKLKELNEGACLQSYILCGRVYAVTENGLDSVTWVWNRTTETWVDDNHYKEEE
jgi:hypothetical protein